MEWVYKNEYDIVDFPVKFYDPFFNINNKEDIIEAEQIEKIINQSQE
jgi:molybdopterin-guanine dinucleotide biosynthesis protein A